MTGVLMKRGNMDVQTHQKEDNVMRHREKTSICKPRREARSRFPLPALRKKPTMPTPGFGASNFQKQDNNFLLFKSPSWWHFIMTGQAN